MIGGRELVVHNLATALSIIGHNVVVVTPYRTGRKVTQEHNYSIVHFGFRGSARLKLNLPLAVSALARTTRRFTIDVINVHYVYIPGSWAFYFTRIFRKMPIIGTPHGDDIQSLPDLQYGVRLNPELDRIVRRNVRSFTCVTAISNSIRKEIRRIIGNDRNIWDVPNGVWVSKFQKKVDKVEIRKKYGIPLNSTAVISVGRNHPNKGFQFGLDAIAKLANTGIKVSYVLVGRDTYPLVERARNLGISDLLVAPGELSPEEVSNLFHVSDIYVSTSFIESFGLATLEAMSSGLPCVVTNVRGNRDLVSPEYGALVESGNAQQLADSIKYLVDNPSVRKHMGIRARSEAGKYDWTKIAEFYVKIYSEAIRNIRNT